MLRLRAFGGLSIQGAEGPVEGAAAQRRRLALLALLAVAGERGTSRDRLLALLWPESEPEKARHVLAQALYALRRATGQEELVLGTTELRLNPQAMTTDVGEFETALAAGDLERACALHAGPFLEGFHLGDAPDFERWVDEQRARLTRLHARALETLAERATAAGRHGEAADRWRLRAALDPVDSRVAIALMRALAAAGDRPGALQHARVYEALVRQELDAAPDPAVVALERELREGVGAPTPRASYASPRVAAVGTAVPSGAPGRPAAFDHAPTAEPDSTVVRVGARVGDRYLPLREIGHGATAIVYLARDEKHDREVALKVLRPELAATVGHGRFLREIAIAARLSHPHIVPLFDSGSSGGVLWYVMPHIEGESLRDRIARERQLPVGDALRIAADVASALAAAHSAGVVHRDIKPGNILLVGGHAVVTDFGIARALRAAADEQLTDGGLVIGTPQYMSPEQAAGDTPVDGRSDIYALGCVLYEMLVGEPPFTGPDAQSVLSRRLSTNAPPIRVTRERVPPEVETLVARALERLPADRWQSASDLAEALADAAPLAGHVSRSPAGPTSREPRSAGASVAWSPRDMIRRALAAPRATVAVLGGTGAVAALLFVAIGGSIWGPEESAGSATPTESTIAVLPFSVRGGEELAFLGEGMVDLLSATLDGGGLHVVDPRAVLAVVGHEGALAPADARAVAERLGARRYVLGDIVESGGRLRVAVLLYDTDGGERAVAQSAAQGSTSDVIPLADTLTARLLAALPGEPTTRLTRLAVATTPSLPALKAYLEGERQFRALRLEDASTALRRAITEDSTFALAWYRLSVVASWRLRHAEAREAIDRALRHSGSLSERGQRLVQAFHAYANGRPDDAERAYRTLLGVYPDDLEASNLLGELLFHFNFLRGRSLLESRQPWEQVLSHEPENRAALLHLAQIASVERDGAAVDSLMRAYLAGAPEDVRTLLPRLFRAMATGDTAARDRILAEFRGASEIALVVTVWNVAVYTGDLDGSIALARMLVDPARSPEARALGHIVLAHLLSARGRRSAAQHHLDSAARTRPLWAAEHRALLTAATPIAATTAEVDSARATLARAAAARGQPPTGEVSPNLWMIVHEDVHPELRRYLEGLLALRSGERGTALAAARDLAATHADGDAAKLARGLADGLRARVALQEGRAGIAATLLDSARLSVPFELAWVSPFFSQADDRFVRAELLARLGRDREALHWFGGFEENSVYDLVYAAPARLRRGEILERLGEREAAIAEYRRVVELWSGGDDDAGRAVADVQARIRRLLGGG